MMNDDFRVTIGIRPSIVSEGSILYTGAREWPPVAIIGDITTIEGLRNLVRLGQRALDMFDMAMKYGKPAHRSEIMAKTVEESEKFLIELLPFNFTDGAVRVAVGSKTLSVGDEVTLPSGLVMGIVESIENGRMQVKLSKDYIDD